MKKLIYLIVLLLVVVGCSKNEMKPAKEKLLFDIQSISFAAHDINLYLDTHPNNQSLLLLYKDYIQRKEELMKNYEKKYGPLTTMSEEIGNNQFNWINSPWPWEGYNV